MKALDINIDEVSESIVDELRETDDDAAADPTTTPAVVDADATKLGTEAEQQAEIEMLDKRRVALKALGYDDEKVDEILAVTLVQRGTQRYLPMAQIVTSRAMVEYFNGRDIATLKADLCKAIRRDGGSAGPSRRYEQLIWATGAGTIKPLQKKEKRKLEDDIEVVKAHVVTLLEAAPDTMAAAERVMDLLKSVAGAGAAQIAGHEGTRVRAIRRFAIAYMNEFTRRALVDKGADPAEFVGYLGMPR